MAPKMRVRKKAAAVALASAETRKKQRVSLESITTGDETAPSSIASPGLNEAETTSAMSIESVSGTEGVFSEEPGPGSAVVGVSGATDRAVGDLDPLL